MTDPDSSAPPALLGRRFAAMLYDLFVLAALWMLVAAIALAIVGIEVDLRNPPLLWQLSLQAALVLITTGYFVLSWTRGGQTIGMRAWRIRVCAADGKPLPPHIAWLRFALAVLSLAALGAGFWVALADPARRTFHDRHCNTRIHLVQ